MLISIDSSLLQALKTIEGWLTEKLREEAGLVVVLCRHKDGVEEDEDDDEPIEGLTLHYTTHFEPGERWLFDGCSSDCGKKLNCFDCLVVDMVVVGWLWW